MNEEQRAARFAAELDHLLEHGAPPPNASEPDLLATAARFAAANFSRDVRQPLAARARRMPRALRALAGLAAAFALLTTLTLTIPPLRAWAQDVLARIGAFVFTDAPSIAEEMAGDPFETPIPDANFIPGLLTAAQASEYAGFSVLVPDYLPRGYQIVQRSAGQNERLSEARTFFSGSAYYETPDFVELSQQLWTVEQPLTWAVGEVEPQTVNVRGVEGLYIPEVPNGLKPDVEGNAEIFTMNMLFWEEGGFNFTIGASALELDVLLRIAESLE